MDEKEVRQILIKLSYKTNLPKEKYVWPYAWSSCYSDPDFNHIFTGKIYQDRFDENRNYFDFILFFSELPDDRHAQLTYDCLYMPLSTQITYRKEENYCKIFSPKETFDFYKRRDKKIIWQIMPALDARKLIEFKKECQSKH